MEAAVEEAENLKGKLAGFKHSYEQVQKELQVATALPRHGIATSPDTPSRSDAHMATSLSYFFIPKRLFPRHSIARHLPLHLLLRVNGKWP